MAIYGGLSAGWATWQFIDRMMSKACHWMAIYTLPGWQESHGIREEAMLFITEGKQVFVLSSKDLREMRANHATGV
jgi:hypothetical protein